MLYVSPSVSAQKVDSDTVALDTSDYVDGDLDYNLIMASYKGYSQEVLRQLNNGANINAVTLDGISALMYAVQNENLEVCKILLYNGANPNLDPYNGVPALITAVKSGNIEITELLIRKGAKINIQDYFGVTPLMNACAFNLITMTDLLLYYDADVNLADNQGNTALILASYYGNTEILQLLIDKQASLEKPDKKGFTALHCATQNGNLDVAEILISKGANMELKNGSGYSPLSLAVQNNNTKLTRFLIEKGAKVNSKISASMNPLNVAKANNNDTIMGLLKDNGAHLNRLPAFSYYSLNFKFSSSTDDFMLGGGLGLHDTRYGLSLNTGYVARLSAKRVLTQETATDYYQYFEKRSYVYLELTDMQSLLSWHNRNSFGIGAGGELIYSFGSYRATSNKPDKVFVLAPEALAYIKLSPLVFTFGYEYLDFKLPDFSPHRFNFGVTFLIHGKHIKQSTKKVLWYI
jgi:ankyrin repeat protein